MLFVSHGARRVTRIERTTAGWDEREFRAGEVVALETSKLAFAVDDAYDGIVLDPT